ncbi:MAG: hypothetical protein ACJAYU_001869, partial [Bradymonadia bacterium]
MRRANSATLAWRLRNPHIGSVIFARQPVLFCFLLLLWLACDSAPPELRDVRTGFATDVAETGAETAADTLSDSGSVPLQDVASDAPP